MGDDEKKNNVCDYCGKSFGLASYLSKHVKRVHNKSSKGEDILKTKFSCEICDKEYSYKHSLQRHIDSVHFPKKSFSCDLCNYKSFRKYSLKTHINNVHKKVSSSAESTSNIKCTYCTSKFSSKFTLKRHEHKKHGIQRFVKTMIKRKCPLCPFSSSKKNKQDINAHFKNRHSLKMEWKKTNFQNMTEFYEWRNTVETDSNTSFVKAKYSTKTSLHYLCHRSGCFKSKGGNKRHLKMMGSCKINAHCPCEIIARSNKNGSVSVSYLPTHVGHKTELKFLRLRLQDRKTLAAKLLSKTPHCEILSGVRRSVSNNELKRIHLINSKDLFNIEKSYNINREAEKHPYDPVSVEAWVQELKSSTTTSQIVYKPQGKYDASFPNLRNEDFVLIFMTEAQKTMLKRFGNDIICIDGTHGLNSYNFQLYTLLAIDESREGFPCAFMFTNRGDISVLSIFFKSIKDVIGQIVPKVFMSDLEETFYSAWVSVMGPAHQRLFCTWHVLKAWRSNLYKIKNKEKKEEAYKTLKTLMYELDTLTFHNLLSAALNKLESDVDTEEYYKYFFEYYIKGEMFKHWAYCYRAHAKINTNMSLENFNRVLKYCYLRGKKVQRLDKTLCAILNLIRDKLFDYVIKIEKGKLVSKLQLLRRRHKTALSSISENHVLQDGDQTWNVMSSTGQELYIVKKVQDCKNCQLQCLHCDTCLHEYICSCIDSSIKNNMCKHIHAVARFILQNKETVVLPVYDGCDYHDLLIDENNKTNVDENILTEISKENSTDEKQVKKQKMREIFDMILEAANTNEQIEFVETKLKSIHQTVKALALTADQPFPEPTNKCNESRGKIVPQRRFFSTKKKNYSGSKIGTFTENERNAIAVKLLTKKD